MKLEDKITSIDDYLEVDLPQGAGKVKGLLDGTHGFYLRGVALAQNFFTRVPVGLPTARNLEYIPRPFWWLHREYMREQYGIYLPPTGALAHVRMYAQFMHLMPHISKDDPELVAFTASIEDGQRDRQTRVSLGRFLRKAYVFISDDAIAQIEAAHRTELNPPVEFIVAEKEPERFVEAYRQISSCMSKSAGSYLTEGHHPVSAYCTPGWQLAVLKNGSGGYSARSLVWINPEDENDKRMVRTYGDTVLHGWLLKNGFKIKNFVGAWLKTKKLPAHRADQRQGLLCPYLDPGEDTDINGYGVWDGEDKIYLLNSKMRGNIAAEFVGSVQASSGVAYMRPFPLNRTCAITGETINALKDGYVEVWKDGKSAYAKKAAAQGWISAIVQRNKRALVEPGSPIFAHGVATYLETEANRMDCGYYKLHANLYPNNQEWRNANNDAAVSRTAGGFILAEDAVHYIDAVPRVNIIHKSELPADAQRVVMYDKYKTFAHKSLATVRTAANRLAIPGVHNIVEGWDGKWYFKKNMRQVGFLGMSIWIPAEKTVAEMEFNELPPHARTFIDDACVASDNMTNAKKRALFRLFAHQGDMLCPKEEVAGGEGKLEALYIFEWREIPLKLVEPWLKADWKAGSIVGAPESRMATLHKFGRMALDAVERHSKWAAAAAPTPKAAKAAEPVAQAA